MKFAHILIAAATCAVLTACAGLPPRPTNIALNDYEPAKQYLSALIKQDMAKHDVQQGASPAPN